MRVLDTADGVTTEVTVELSRRNLEALLAKLDYNKQVPPFETLSACTIWKQGVSVRAVEDEEHYRDGEPGPMLDNKTGVLY